MAGETTIGNQTINTDNADPDGNLDKPAFINMRVDPKTRNLIDMAAAMSGSDRTSFILDAACQKAEDVLLDKRFFMLDGEAFDTFERALEANPFGEKRVPQDAIGKSENLELSAPVKFNDEHDFNDFGLSRHPSRR